MDTIDIETHKKYIIIDSLIDDKKKYNVPELEFYFLTMVNNESRLKNVYKQMNTHNIKTKVFHAVNGVDINMDELVKKGYFNKNLEMKRPGEWGCALSHVLLWEYMIKRNKPYMIVVEDDTDLNPNFHIKIKNFMDNVPKDFDICQIHHHKAQEHLTFHPKYKTNNKYILSGFPQYGTVCYVVSLEGAKKLVKLCKPLVHAIDMHILNGIGRGILKSYIPAEVIVNMRYAYQSMIKSGDITAKYSKNNDNMEKIMNIGKRIEGI